MMKNDAVALFGIDEPVAERRLLRAGALTAILEDGNLRTISFGGIEAVRAVNYLARDNSWGTYAPEITNLLVSEEQDSFEVEYDGRCSGPEGSFSYKMRIMGEASGRLTMSADGVADTDFSTNRTGFVVLHPAEAAGGAMEIRHTGGTVEKTAFPLAISPDQPAFDIAAITNEPVPGLTCTVEMEGDAFEMEDQRNWSDASYKTYVRPLSKPRPFVMAKGTKDSQRVTVTFSQSGAVAAPAGGSRAVLAIGEAIGTMPKVALFLDDEFTGELSGGRLTAQEVVARFDVADAASAKALTRAKVYAASIGAGLVVEVVFDCRDPQTEAKVATDAIREASVSPTAILVSARRDFKTRQSNTVPAGEQPIDAVVTALRAENLGAPIGAGTSSFFTEFNRNPPGAAGDFVFFGVGANVHSSDDVSVMETLSVYPAIVDSARRLCPGKPVWLGPCTIAMRHNPYGASVADNPGGGRKAMIRRDPRYAALFGAAFMAGAAARAVASGVDCLTLGAPAGDFGLVRPNGEAQPVLAVHEALAKAAGARSFAVSATHPNIAALAFGYGKGKRLVVANLGAETVAVALPDRPQAVELVGAGAAEASASLVLKPYRTAVVDLG